MMSEEYEDELENEDWPYDEDGDWDDTILPDDWDEIDDVDDYRYVDEREDFD